MLKQFRVPIGLVLMAFALSSAAAKAAWDDATVINEATSGRFKNAKGEYFDKDCGQPTAYEADVVDLNADGQPEVFLQIFGTCHGGGAGVFLTLYIKGADGRWQQQFGFPGMYKVLATNNKGYPDIEIGGPGTCFPVWRWNGKEYALFRKCPR